MNCDFTGIWYKDVLATDMTCVYEKIEHWLILNESTSILRLFTYLLMQSLTDVHHK